MDRLLLVLVRIWNRTFGAFKTPRVNIREIERSEAIQIKDMRPAAERQGKTFGLLVTSRAFGTYRVADSRMTPSPIRLLQHRAYERFGGGTAPLDISVQHLVVYRNQQAQVRSAAVGGAIGGALGGIVGAALGGRAISDSSGATTSLVDPEAFESLAASEYERALYAKDHVAGRSSSHLVYIDTVIGGKRVFTRTTAPLKFKAGGDALTAVVEASIAFHLSRYQQEQALAA